MSDGNHAEDAASAMDSASTGPSPAALASLSDAPDRAASSGVFSTFINAVSSAIRPMNLNSILNNDADEVVAGSDQDGDQASPTGTSSGLVAASMEFQPTIVQVEADVLGQDDAAAGLLMGLAISASHDDSVATTTVANGEEAMQVEAETAPSQAEAEDVAMAEVVAAEQVPEVAEPRRDKRGRIIPPRTKTAKGKAKSSKKAASKASAQLPVATAVAVDAANGPMPTEPATLAEAVQALPATKRTREKRRTPPPPAPVQPTPSKKTKAAAKTPPAEAAPASTRPKRDAKFIRSYAEITLTEEDEEDDDDIPMVIASENVRASLEAEAAAAAAAKAGSVPAASGKKVMKRKTMSKRQFDELMSDVVEDVSNDVEAYEVEELTSVAPVPQTAPGVKQRPCVFCRLDHSAFAMFYCHSCHRMYHGKCLVDAFRPAMKEGVPIEDQMEALILYRPGGHSSVLRCVSCQAALIDLHNRPEIHRDCTCPTCLKSPQKTADYRRVSLKMIVDQHNLDFALKKEQKGGKGAKKTGTTAAPPPTKPSATKTPKGRGTAAKDETAAPATPADETAPSGRARGARSTRRTRDSDEPDEEDNHPAPGNVTAAQSEQLEQQAVIPAANKAKVTVSIKSGRRVRARGSKGSPGESMVVDSALSGHVVEEAEAMEVDSETTSHTNGVTSGDTKTHERVEAEDTDQVTESTYEQLIQITKDDAGDSWSFRVACSSSGKANESGMYKEATFVWHPNKDKELECCCCNKSKQSLRWFVQHTDPSLLARNDDPYAYMFVVQKNGKLVSLEHVLGVMRSARSRQRRLSGGGEPDHNVKDELSEERKQAMAALNDVVFKPTIVRDRKRRSSNPGVLPEFACEVVCAEGRYMTPLASDNSLLRCSFYEVSDDVWRRGELEVRENPRDTRTCKIFCECCKERLTTKQFREHLQKPLEVARDELLKLDEEQRKAMRENGYDSDDQDRSSYVNTQPTRSVSVALGVRQRQSTALKMDRFFWAIAQLGSQAEINKAIAAIVQTQCG